MKSLFSLLFLFLVFSLPGSAQNSVALPGNSSVQKPILTFGVITDIQYCDQDNNGTRFYRSSLAKLENALTTLKKDSVKFVVNLGDMIDKGYESYTPVMDRIKASGILVYHITGNHDYAVEPSLKTNLPVPGKSKKGYYSVTVKKTRFVFLNGNEISTYASADEAIVNQNSDLIAEFKKKGAKNAFAWNGGISSQQLDWFNKQLEDATHKNEKVIILCHFPVVPDNPDNLLNYKEVLQRLEKYHNIIAWFNGHSHGGNYGYQDKIHFVTFKGMVETENQNSFAVVKVFKDKLEILGYGREPNRTLHFE